MTAQQIIDEFEQALHRQRNLSPELLAWYVGRLDALRRMVR
ncbi:hypothetical protein [Paraburkholderia tropica]|nr:hypothetical protein [Paraburkholderia tropica]